MRESRWQQFDFVIVACVLGLVLAGVAMIHSATCASPCTGLLPPSSYAVRQGLSAAAGFALLVGISLIDYRIYRVYAFHLYGFALALLVLVLVIGQGGADADYGSKRWINLGAFDLQASEVAKLAVLIVLARVLGDKPEGALSFRRLMASLGLVIVPVILVFVEPDLGTSLSFLMIWVTVVLVAGIKWRHALLLLAGSLVISPLVWLGMKDYMRERLMTFMGTLFDLEHAAFDEGYNVLQARISIGSGGLFGRGYLEGTQSQLGFLRITQSDFIFLFAAVANLGANLTLLPVTGIPLPFISYGRTSLLTTMAALGIVQSVLLYRLKYRY
jgi:rod shape determining protein RodA